MVFIAAYGLASQSIMYPNSPLEWTLIQDVLRKAYWQIYGELFLEEIEGKNIYDFYTNIEAKTTQREQTPI